MNAKPLITAIAVILSAALLTCAGNAPANQTGSSTSQTPYFTGDGGKGKSITILPPRGVGLTANQAILPDLVANELLSNFSSCSAMTLFDRVNLQKQYDELLSGLYDDNDAAGLDLGHLSSTDYMLLGDITRTSNGFALQLTVNRNSDKTTVASYSQVVSVAELENLSGVRRASLDLLQKMGVQVTERARTELTAAATDSHVNAQTALAQGIVAQRGGNEFEAMTDYFKARTFSPDLPEAQTRTVSAGTTLAANNFANTGARGRVLSEIEQRLEEARRVEEREKNIEALLRQATAFYKAHQPYSIGIRNTFSYGNIDPQRRTVDIGVLVRGDPVSAEFEIIKRLYELAKSIHPQSSWPYNRRGVMTLFDEKTNFYPGIWNLTGSPRLRFSTWDGVWAIGPTFTVATEIVNSNGKVLKRVTFRLEAFAWESYDDYGSGIFLEDMSDDWYFRDYYSTAYEGMRFFTIKADDLTDNLTLRIVSVNGRDINSVIRNGSVQIPRISASLTGVDNLESRSRTELNTLRFLNFFGQ